MPSIMQDWAEALPLRHQGVHRSSAVSYSAPASAWRSHIDAAHDLQTRPSWLSKVLSAPKPPRTNTKQVTALSGGKDSSAMAVAMAYFEPGDQTYVITPTGNELPAMVSHWLKLGAMLGSPLVPVSRQSLQGLIRQERMLPNHRARFCTRKLKLEQYYGWLAAQTPCISYVGLRADEESRTGMIFPDASGVQMDFPMRRWGWTLNDVVDFLAWIGLDIPDRTDCAMCFWQKLGEWFGLWRDHPDLWREAEELELWVQEERGSPVTLRSPSRDTWPADLRSLRLRFEAGDVPTRSLVMMDKRRQVGACRACTL